MIWTTPPAALFYRSADAESKSWIKPYAVVMVDHSGDWFEAKVIRVGANEVEIMYRMDNSTEVIKGKHKIEKRMLASRHHACALPPALPHLLPVPSPRLTLFTAFAQALGGSPSF